MKPSTSESTAGSLNSHRENLGTNFASLVATDLNAGERPRTVAN